MERSAPEFRTFSKCFSCKPLELDYKDSSYTTYFAKKIANVVVPVTMPRMG